MAIDPEIEEVLEHLNARRKQGYGPKIPSDLDLHFVRLAERYSLVSKSERAEIRASVPDTARLLILGFSDRLSILAMRSGETRYVLLALLAHAIEDFAHDPRENLIRLALANHVAARLGIDAKSVFKQAASLASERAATNFEAFGKRDEALKSLAAMGIKEVMTDEGVDYRYV